MNFIALDFETANSNRQSVCSIGLTFIENDEIVHTINQLIKPTPNYYDGINISIHGITKDMTANAPTFSELWPDLLPIFKNADIVAHNASFDFSALRYVLEAYHIEFPVLNYYCTMMLSKKLYPHLENHKLPTVCDHLNISDLQHHDAESDALACAKIMLQILKDHDSVNFDDLSAKIGFTKGNLNPFGYRPFRCKQTRQNKPKSPKCRPLSGEVLKPDFENARNKTNPFYMKKVVISGFSTTDKKVIARELKELGADVDTAITQRTNYLIAGANVGPSKTQKMEANIEKGKEARIINFEEYCELIKQ